MKKIIILLLCVFTVCGCTPKENVIVEQFVGHHVDEVYAWCAKLDDSHGCDINFEDVEGFEKDIVYEQSVKPGNKLSGNISFMVASGNMIELVLPFISPEVTMSDLEVWKVAAGATNVSYVFEENDEVEKNHAIRMEPTAHVYKDTPITFYISSGPKPVKNDSIEITYGDYLGLTVEQFEKRAKALGLKPNHQTSRDKYDPNIGFGEIVWHGSGTYVKDEVFNYGVCINAITVTPGQFIGKTEKEFIKIGKDMSLSPLHIDGRDAYSTAIAKGSIVTHGNGVYVEGEDFKYGLSLGPAKIEQGYEGAKEAHFLSYLEGFGMTGDRKAIHSNTVSAGRIISYNYGKYSTGDCITYYVSEGPEDTAVKVPDFSGKKESDLLKFLKKNGLYAGKRTEEASSTYAEGTIIRNDSGQLTKGDYVDYVVASARSETARLQSFKKIKEQVSHEGDYEHARYDMQRYLFGRGFMDYDIVPVVYENMEPGILLGIYVNGEPHTAAADVPITSYVYVMISSSID